MIKCYDDTSYMYQDIGVLSVALNIASHVSVYLSMVLFLSVLYFHPINGLHFLFFSFLALLPIRPFTADKILNTSSLHFNPIHNLQSLTFVLTFISSIAFLILILITSCSILNFSTSSSFFHLFSRSIFSLYLSSSSCCTSEPCE